MLKAYKTVSIDGNKYDVKVVHAPLFTMPYRYEISIYRGNEFLKNGHANDVRRITLKEFVKESVKAVHYQIERKKHQEDTIKKFNEELESWDGIINVE